MGTINVIVTLVVVLILFLRLSLSLLRDEGLPGLLKWIGTEMSNQTRIAGQIPLSI